jgi:arsenate reductase
MSKKKNIIFICTGNACRSQIAHGLLQNLAKDRFNVFSAGSHPSRVHLMSIKVMEEIGIDISHHKSDHIDEYLDKGIDIVITVCDNANKLCPVFPGNVERLHWSIDDPFRGWDYNENQMESFRVTREEIKARILDFLQSK